MPEAVLRPGVPAPAQYMELRALCGLGGRSPAAAEAGLPRTVYGVVIEVEDRLIGMGRLIGDGGCFVQVTDIAVHPDWQGCGWGRRIVAALMSWADAELPSGCYISLIADAGAERLYEKAGFRYRTGMARTVP
ncbi:MAG: GNAT family N-acetyltransferase [Pseudomonadota bacterium]